TKRRVRARRAVRPTLGQFEAPSTSPIRAQRFPVCVIEARETDESAKKQTSLFQVLSESAHALRRLFALRRGPSIQDNGNSIFGRAERKFCARAPAARRKPLEKCDGGLQVCRRFGICRSPDCLLRRQTQVFNC